MERGKAMNAIRQKIRMLLLHKSKEELLAFDLKKTGIQIGEHCKFWDPDSVLIDTQRPHMLHIGDYCKITSGVTILAHDYSRSVLTMYSGTNIGEAKQTWIGENVFIGMKAIILMGSHIGDNSIVGAGSVVSGRFPDGMVIAGNPAKIICTIDEFYEKRKSQTLTEAIEYVKLWKKQYGKYPTLQQMTNAFSWLYLPRNQDTINKYPEFFDLNGIDNEKFKQNFLSSPPPQFSSFEEFLQYAIDNISKEEIV